MEVSWDAQADLETALLKCLPLSVCSVDYFKYFDSFGHKWVHGFLKFLGFPPALTDMTLNLYENLMRSIKFGIVYGKPVNYYNGCGRGDLCSLFPAIALVSGQFFMVDLCSHTY